MPKMRINFFDALNCQAPETSRIARSHITCYVGTQLLDHPSCSDAKMQCVGLQAWTPALQPVENSNFRYFDSCRIHLFHFHFWLPEPSTQLDPGMTPCISVFSEA